MVSDHSQSTICTILKKLIKKKAHIILCFPGIKGLVVVENNINS